MLALIPVTEKNLPDFIGTSYETMPDEEKLKMIKESVGKEHNGRYFELFAVYDGEKAVGLMNLFAHSPNVISVGPEIKREQRGRGYGFAAEKLALEYAKEAGYKIASASVREDNAASVALHEKLGFEVIFRCFNKSGKPIRIYLKSL